MPTVCTITLDATDYKAKLAEIVKATQDASAQLAGTPLTPPAPAPIPAPAAASAAAPAREAAESMGTLADNTERAGQRLTSLKPGQLGNVNNSAKRATESLSKAAGAVGAISNAVGAADPKLGVLAQTLSALVSGPVAICTAAIGLIIAGLAKFYEFVMPNNERVAAQMQGIAEAAGKQTAEVEKSAASMGNYLSRLDELGNSEKKTNAERAEAASLLKIMSSEYGDLGVSIDDVINKTERWNSARSKMEYSAREDKLAVYRAEAAALENSGNAQARVNGNAPDGTVNTVGTVKARIGILNQHVALAGSQAELDSAKAEIAIREKQLAVLQKIENIKKFGSESKEAAAAEAAKKTREAAAAAAAQEAAERPQRQRNEASAQKAREAEKAAREAMAAERETRETQQRELDYGALSTNEQRITFLRGEIQKERAKRTGLSKEVDTANSQINSADTQEERNDMLYVRAKLQKQISDSVVKELNTQAQILKLQQEGSKALRESLRERLNALRDTTLRDSGNTLQADIEKMRHDAAQTAGGSLGRDQLAMVDRIASLTNALNSQRGVELGEGIKTNALTARGGFQGAAAVPETERINRAVLSQQTRSAKTLTEISKLLDKVFSDGGSNS